MITRAKIRLLMTVMVSLVLVTGWPVAQATTTKTATFLVSLIINSDCAIAANPLNFGSSGVLAANIPQTTTLSVTCSNTTPYNIGLDAGNVGTSTVAARLLANGGLQ